MKKTLENKLLDIAKKNQTKNDPSHDFQHVFRVYKLAAQIGKNENADLDIIIPAALFHDIIVYLKNHPNSKNEAHESAEFAKNTLMKIKEYPKSKISRVCTCIEQCSFSKGITPELLESKILQDADRLEATGAISIMRTFSSCGQMNRPFYEVTDPLCKKSTVKFRSGIDLFFERLLKVEKGMHTKTAKRMAKHRTIFLNKFLSQTKKELAESGVI